MTFVLLARDAAAPAVINFWVSERIRLKKNDFNDPQIIEALECAATMRHQHNRALSEPCPDCMAAAKHAYSNATTPGFFYPRCEKHRI
jgi:hypothetical protein